MSTSPKIYGKRTPTTAKEAARFEYQRQWHIAKKYNGTPRGDAARQWLAARAAALRSKSLTPTQKRARARLLRRCLAPDQKARLSEKAKERYHRDPVYREAHLAMARAHYRRNREKILARSRAYGSQPAVKARRRKRLQSRKLAKLSQ